MLGGPGPSRAWDTAPAGLPMAGTQGFLRAPPQGERALDHTAPTPRWRLALPHTMTRPAAPAWCPACVGAGLAGPLQTGDRASPVRQTEMGPAQMGLPRHHRGMGTTPRRGQGPRGARPDQPAASPLPSQPASPTAPTPAFSQLCPTHRPTLLKALPARGALGRPAPLPVRGGLRALAAMSPLGQLSLHPPC